MKSVSPQKNRLFRDAESPRLSRWSEWGQVLFFTAWALLLNFAVATLILPFRFTDAEGLMQDVTNDMGPIASFMLIVFIGPLTETAYGQFFPLFAAKIFRRSRFTSLVWAAGWFSILHIANGPANFIQSFFIGYILAVAFLFCWNDSWIKAYRVTAAAHALHNLIVYSLFLATNSA